MKKKINMTTGGHRADVEPIKVSRMVGEWYMDAVFRLYSLIMHYLAQ
ncbi:MAG TPA: hypothetical protein VKR53_15835 [Puia sp.]|nr:hypothetical protein [Puia sp.]